MKGPSIILLPFLVSIVVAGCSGGSSTSHDDQSHNHGETTGKPSKPAVPALKDLKIEDVKKGTGVKAEDGDIVTVLYRGTLADGTEFDGNMGADGKARLDREPFPLELGMGKVIKGWDKGVKGIQVGGERKLSIPSDQGYGDQVSGKIPANSDLYFTVKCLDIVKRGEEMVIDTKDVKVGSGPAVKNGDSITVHYVGKFINGKQFDSSRERNKPYTLKVGAGEVIAGFDKGVQGMKKGGIRTIRIPPGAGYGAGQNGAIPANSVLNFEIEVLKINGK